MEPYFSFNQLNSIPAATKLSNESKKIGNENQPIIMAIWYKPNANELNTQANKRVETLVSTINENPLKKNSSKNELIKDIYIATKIKLLAFTPIPFVNCVVI